MLLLIPKGIMPNIWGKTSIPYKYEYHEELSSTSYSFSGF